MELILKRIAKRKSYTIGKLYIKTHPQTPPVMEGRLAGAETEEQTHRAANERSEALPLTGERGEGLLLYFCDTLEPTWRDYAHGGYKVKGHSAIPEGRYPVVVSWSPKFQQWLPLLLHVPKFEGIRIHAGNTCCDTAGCILLGENREVGKVLDSRRYVNLLKRRLAERPVGEAVYLTIM